MKRIVKEYAVRSDEILDAAQQFVRKVSGYRWTGVTLPD
jgi:hypothetical protein